MSRKPTTDEKKRLFSACKNGDLETVKRLSGLVDIRNIQDQSYYSYSPLHHAARNGHLNVVTYLVTESLCDCNINDSGGWTPLHLAYNNEHFDVVRYLVNEAHCDTHVKDSDGWTPLHYACRHGHLDLVSVLMTEAHCDSNLKSNDGSTPLHYACWYGNLDVVRYLVTEAHSDTDVKNKDGWTPLHHACRNGHLNVARYLITQAQCDPNFKNKNGLTPLHNACSYGHLDVVRYLVIEAHSDTNIKTKDGLTPLHYASQKGHLNMARCLVTEAHCDTNVNDIGWTPLHYACERGHLDVVRYLVTEVHYDPNVKDMDGWTPIFIACRGGLLEIARYLVTEAHCDINVTTKDGLTPLNIAYQNEHFKIVTFMMKVPRCDTNIKDKDGYTTLHYACKDGLINLVRDMVTKAHCDPNVENKDGWTPLHIACSNGHLTLIKYLVTEANCDPNAKSENGWTPLHLACMSGSLNLVRYLVTDTHCDINVKNENGWTPLHCAYKKEHFDVVRYLINEANCDTDVKDSDGWTPLHYACKHGHLDVVKHMVTTDHCDPNVMDNDRWTPLHHACWDGAADTVEYLLTECHCDPNCTTKNGATPLAIAWETNIIRLLLQHGAVATDLYKYKAALPHGISMQPAQSTVAVFMVGDKGAGKSTLTKAMMTEKEGMGGWTAKRFKLGGVKKKTAGIECHTIHSPRIGSFTIYDLAGHREFHNSHDTVIRNSISGPSSGMFLFIIDLTASLDGLKRTLSYWISFIQNQVCIEPSVQVTKPYLLAVGSHADSVHPKRDLEGKEILIRHFCEDAENICFVGYVSVDCRYSESPALTQLRSHMRNMHDVLQSAAPDMTFLAHCFHVYLVSECGNKPGMQLGDLLKANPDDVQEKVLPRSPQSLHEACQNLNERGIMLYIQTKSIETSWIVIDKDVLLCEVNGSIFAPETFREHKELTRTGVVPFSKICSEFDQLTRTREIDPQLIVDFLVHLEFCREMREDDGLKLVTETHPKYKEERHFLFPALTPPSPPSDIWQPNPLISYSEYSSCWLLQCHEHHHYLTSRFREVLLLRLAFTHAFPVKPDEIDPTSPTFHQACTIWKYGIKWTTRSFIDALVEVNDESVFLLLRCKEGKELSLVKIRAQVMAEILSVKRELCSNAEISERFIPNPTYPVETKSFIPITDIAHAVYSHEDAVLLTKDTPLEISRLLFFEPYSFCNPQCLVDVNSTQLESCKVKQHFIDHISENLLKCVDGFCKLLDVPLHKVAVESNSSDQLKAVKMFQEWQSQSKGTYQCLRQQMDHYSVFSGRNILEIVGVRHVALSSSKQPPVTRENSLDSKPTLSSSTPLTLDSKLDSKPTLRELQSRELLQSRQYNSVTEGIAVKWRNVAIALNITSPRISILERDSHGVEDACIKMLQWWLENAENPTWCALIEALRDVGDLQVLVRDIEKALFH